MLKNVVNFFKFIYYKVLEIIDFFRIRWSNFQDWRDAKITLFREKKNSIEDNLRDRFLDTLTDKIFDFIDAVIRKTVRFFWYLDFLERFFDVIEHVCYYWIKVPYQKYENHFYTVILPPIREKYIKWRSKKHSRFRLFRRKQRVLIRNYIKAKWPNFLTSIEKFLNYLLDLYFFLFKFIFKKGKFTNIKNKLINFTKLKPINWLINYIKETLEEAYAPVKPYVDDVIKHPDIRYWIDDIFYENGWAWYPAGLAFYQFLFLIYVVWLRYQFFYDISFAYMEFYNQRIAYVIHARRALFENTEMWGNAYLTSSFSPDNYYNSYYDKENKFRAAHLFYDKFVLSPLQGYKAFSWYDQGPSVFHWGSLSHWQRQGAYKTFNIADSFMERVLPQYYIKKIDTCDRVLYLEDFFAESNEDSKVYKFKENVVREIYDIYKFFFKNTKDEDEKKLLKNLKLKKFGKFNMPERWYGVTEKMYCRELYSFVNYENFLSRARQNRNFDELTHLNLIKSFENWDSRVVTGFNMNFMHFDSFDKYSIILARSERWPAWFLALNKDLALVVAYRNDFYNLFKNDFLGCALKNFFVFEHIFTYILNGLNEMNINEVVAKRYTSEAFLHDWYLITPRRTKDAALRRGYYRSCFWENYNYFKAPFRWRALNVARSHFWDYRAHIGTYLWPIYYGETDTSYWGLRNYFYAFSYMQRPYYYYLNLTHYFYREIFGHVWILLSLVYWGFISVAVELVHRRKEDNYFYKETGIKELDYLIRANLWIKSYKTVYFFLFFLLTIWFTMDFYAAKNTFVSVYYPLINAIKEFQELNELYCDFNDYAYGEDFLFLVMGPEFFNYSDVSKRFLKDPYLVEELDLYENSFKRRDLSFDYEFFMSDNYFFLRLYTSNLPGDTLFYKNWWVESFAAQISADDFIDDVWPFLLSLSDLVPVLNKYNQKPLENMKQHITKVKQRMEIFDHFFLLNETVTNLGFKKFFGSLFSRVAYNKEYNDYTILNKEFHDALNDIEKSMMDYFYLRKPNFTKRSYRNYNFEFKRLKKLTYLECRETINFFNVFDTFKLPGNISDAFFSAILLSPSEKKYFSKYKENPEKAIFYAFFEPIFDVVKKIYEFETKELNFRIKTIPAIFKFSYTHSLSEEHFYSFYLLHNKNHLNYFKDRDKNYFEIATNWSNIINPFSFTTAKFFPHLYFEEDWFQLFYKKIFKLKYDHFQEMFRFHRFSIKWAKKDVKKIEDFQSYFKFPYIMAQRIAKSHLYLEVISQLDRLDIDNLQNVRLNHEASRTIFSKRYFRRIQKHFKIYFDAKWVYGTWDERAIKLDNAISNFCHYYIRSGRYHNLNRMSLYTIGVKKYREIQWENREIPAPPNHMLEDALWYRFNVSSFKKGLGCRRINPEWFVYSGFGNRLERFKKFDLSYLKCTPFLHFLQHTKDLPFYTFNPKKDIIENNQNVDFSSRPNFLIYDLDPVFPAFGTFNRKLRERIFNFYDDNRKLYFDEDDYYARIKYEDLFKFDSYAFWCYESRFLRKYHHVKKKEFNLFQFIFFSYFGSFTNSLLDDYFIYKNNISENFETLLNINELRENIGSRMLFYYLPSKLEHYVFYPIRNFGFFKFDIRVKDTKKYTFSDWNNYHSRNRAFFAETYKLNHFFKIEEISPSWSKITITIEDIKNFHEDYESLTWFNIIKVVKENNGYWFYFLYKSTFIILIFINLLYFFNEIMISSIKAFKYNKTDKKFYKFGKYLYDQGSLLFIANNIFLYWIYWVFFFIFFQIIFWLDEFFIFIIWTVNSVPFIIDFIFY